MAERIKIGSLINGRYEILKLIGSGGMADVYKAQCLKLNRFVAIKFLKKEFLADREFAERFDAEARAAAGIVHPNIVSVYDVGLSEAGKYIVMEYVEGITLKEYIDENGKLTWREAASVAGQISSALSCAHKNGIIHRDIKPHNIIITTQGTAKVTDFGIAKAVSQSTIVKTDGNILGSAHYFSPEQGMGGAVDKTTDIYSLGVVMFEMLTGKVPYDNQNPLSLALMHSNSPIPAIDTDAPEALKKVVYTAMSKDREDRYAEAAYMLEDIKNILRGQGAVNAGGGANKGSVQRRSNKAQLAKKKRLINLISIASIAVAVIVILVLLVSFVSSFVGGEKPITTQPPVATDNKEDENEIEIEDVINKTEEEAKKMLEDAGFEVEVKEAVTDKDEEVGVVIAQLPYSGSIQPKGSKVTIFIGKKIDDDNLEIPKVVGYTEAEAAVLLESSGFKVSVEYKETDESKHDRVIEQNPLGGEKLKKGSTVGLVVGKKAEKPEVTPDTSENEGQETETKTEVVTFSVPEGDEEQKVRVTVDGKAVLEGSYRAGQKVSVNVKVKQGETKTVIFYVNDKAAWQTEVK